MVAELQFVGIEPHGQPKNLMPQANAEDGSPPDQSPNRFDRVGDPFRIPWTVREDDAVRLYRFHRLDRRGGRHHRHGTAHSHQPTQDVLFDAEVIRDDPERRATARLDSTSLAGFAPRIRHPHSRPVRPFIGPMAGDVRNEVTPQDAGSSPRLFHDTTGIQVHMRDHALLRTCITQMSR